MPANSLTIQLGDMRRPIKLFQRTDTQDTAGGETDSAGGVSSVIPARADIGGGVFTPMFGGITVFAADEHRKSSPQDVGGKLVVATYHTYTIRFHVSILAAMPELYIQDATFPRIMLVQGCVDPDGERHWLQLSTQDVEG